MMANEIYIKIYVGNSKIINLLPTDIIIRKILKHLDYSQMPVGWKFLDRVEPSISNDDETQQLRLHIFNGPKFNNRRFCIYGKDTDYVDDVYYIRFDSRYQKIKMYDMKNISIILKKAIEQKLSYRINDPIIIKEYY